MKKVFSALLAFSLLASSLAACGENAGSGQTNNNSQTTAPVLGEENTNPAETSGAESTSADEDLPRTDADMFTERDSRTAYDESKSVQIQLNGTTATASSNSVQIAGSRITITEEATYILSGKLDDGMIIVNAPDTAKLQIVLKGADITSRTSAPLYILEADKVFLTLAEGTENFLSNGGEFTAIDENNIDGALFSKQDLTLNGSGSLTVSSPAGHGIVCKDDLVFTGGSYTVNSASHGLDANDSVRVTGETSLTIDSGKDGIHCENTDDPSLGFVYIAKGTVNIEAEGDGISAGGSVQIEGGSFDLLVGGGSANGSKASSGNYGGFMGGGHGGGMRPGAPGNPGTLQTAAVSSEDESSTSMKGIKAANAIHQPSWWFLRDGHSPLLLATCHVTLIRSDTCIGFVTGNPQAGCQQSPITIRLLSSWFSSYLCIIF